jgi:hypothetical protein
VLELGPSRWSLVEALARKEPYPYHISGIEVWRKRSRGSSTHELTRSRVTKGACAKAQVVVAWRCKARLVLSCAGQGFHEGPVDQIHEVPIGI